MGVAWTKGYSFSVAEGSFFAFELLENQVFIESRFSAPGFSPDDLFIRVCLSDVCAAGFAVCQRGTCSSLCMALSENTVRVVTD